MNGVTLGNVPAPATPTPTPATPPASPPAVPIPKSGGGASGGAIAGGIIGGIAAIVIIGRVQLACSILKVQGSALGQGALCFTTNIGNLLKLQIYRFVLQ